MNTITISVPKKGKKHHSSMDNICFIHLQKGEALKLIRSLAHQLEDQNPNTHREEFFLSDGKKKSWYFSVSVEPDPVRDDSPELTECVKRMMKKYGWKKGDDV